MITKIKSLFLYLKKKIIWLVIGGAVVLAAPMAIPQEPIGEPGPAVYANEDIQEKRNLNSKHFDNGDGSFTMNAHMGHIHFENDSGELENVDCRFTPRAYGGWEMRANNYELKIPARANGWFKFINSFGYDSQGKEKVDNPNEAVSIRPLGITNIKGTHIVRLGWEGKGIVLYENAYGQNIDLEVMARNTGFVKEVVINKKPSDLSKDLEFSFEVDIGDLEVKPKKADYMNLREERVKAFKGLKGKELIVKQKLYEDDWEREVWDKSSVLETSDSIILEKLRKTWFRKFNLSDSEGKQGLIKVRMENINGKIILTKVLDKTFLENAVYPVRTDTTTSYYAGAGDGKVYKSQIGQPSQTNWNTVHDATTGLNSDTYIHSAIFIKGNNSPNDYIGMYRVFIPISTSSLSASATIDSAVLKLYGYEKQDDYNGDGYDYVAIVQTDQPSSSSLTTSDFNNCGIINNPTKGSANIDITGLHEFTQYDDFILNEAGKGWIKKSGESSNCGGGTGTTCLGLRTGHDIQDFFPGDPGESNKASGYNPFSYERSGTSEDPYLSVTYTVAGTNTQINIADAWKEIASMKINIGDVWKDVASMKINIGDAWKVVF